MCAGTVHLLLAHCKLHRFGLEYRPGCQVFRKHEAHYDRRMSVGDRQLRE